MDDAVQKWPAGDRRPSTEDRVLQNIQDIGDLESDVAALREQMRGDIRRLETLHAGVIREVDNAREAHDKLHMIEDKHLDVAREAQEHRNQMLTQERERQMLRDDKFAQKETMETAMVAIRRSIDENGSRIRELELSQRSSSGEKVGAVEYRKDGQASQAQVVSYAMAALALIAIIATVLVANFAGG